jgi:hypothetical protein
MAKKSLHSICRWTFNAGKGGFLAADIEPQSAGDKLCSAEMIQFVQYSEADRPDTLTLEVEAHYDGHVSDEIALQVLRTQIELGCRLLSPEVSASARCSCPELADSNGHDCPEPSVEAHRRISHQRVGFVVGAFCLLVLIATMFLPRLRFTGMQFSLMAIVLICFLSACIPGQVKKLAKEFLCGTKVKKGDIEIQLGSRSPPQGNGRNGE